MHKPSPFGTYPLVLRNYNIHDYRSGELLYDYTDNDLYVSDRTNNNTVTRLSKMIYEKSRLALLKNSNLSYRKDNIDIDKRDNNSFYLIGGK